jgi:hypothetical protein
MGGDNGNWGVKEWRAYALMLEKAHEHALDGWAASVDELEQHSQLLRQYMNMTAQFLDDAKAQNAPPISGAMPPPRKTRGRPKLNAELPGCGILDIFDSMRSDYLKAHPESKPSIKQVIEWSVGSNLVKNGKRASRVNDPDVQASIKTMRNQISDARNPVLPKKSR